MSRLDDLIDELCPDGVEYKTLALVCKFQRGTSITQKDVTDGDIPVIAGGQKPAYYHNVFNRTGETIVISSSGAYAGFVSYWTIPIFLSDSFSVNPDMNYLTPKYLFYFLKSIQVKIHETKKGGGVPHVHGSSIANFRIPLPPLPVQEEIVRILDQFTALEAELEAELEARKKQYEYYCKMIFATSKGAEMVRIGDLGKWSGGMTPSMSNKAYWENGNIPWISSKDMKNSTITDTQDHITELAIKETSAKLLPANITTIVARSGILKHTLPVVFVPFASTVNQDIKALKVRSGIHPSYAYFVISAHSEEILRKTKKSGGTVDSLDVQAFMNFKVPLVVMDEQLRIISIMEGFNTLVNDLTQGLPAEIAARRKQYEYYRDKLLSFKEAVS